MILRLGKNLINIISKIKKRKILKKKHVFIHREKGSKDDFDSNLNILPKKYEMKNYFCKNYIRIFFVLTFTYSASLIKSLYFILLPPSHNFKNEIRKKLTKVCKLFNFKF